MYSSDLAESVTRRTEFSESNCHCMVTIFAGALASITESYDNKAVARNMKMGPGGGGGGGGWIVREKFWTTPTISDHAY